MAVLRCAVIGIVCILLTGEALLSPASSDELLPQEMIKLPVKVVDEDGQPLAGVKIIPWALRSSQGHGGWPEKLFGEIPQDETDDDGHAEITYPRYNIPGEFVRTTAVTLSVNHPDYVFISHEDVLVPRKQNEPHTVTVKRGATLEILPTLDGKPLNSADIYAIWSDARSWQKDSAPKANREGRLVIPSMPPGKGQVLLARIENGKTTHLSSIETVELQLGETQSMDVPLVPALNIAGRLSDDVPRPIRNGRVVVRTLAKDPQINDVMWGTWAEVSDDGTFEVVGWPAYQAIQLIALCDGYIARSGSQPEEVGTPPREQDPFQRPQVFRPDVFETSLVVQMEPMVDCLVTVVDDQHQPVRDAKVRSNPNVCWWNDGSQIYGDTLFRSAECMAERDWRAGISDTYPAPFAAETDERGTAHLFLPAAKQESLYVLHDQYELPVILGVRRVRINPMAGEPNQTRLVLQRKGQEFLGEWDKLAGILFGCTGEECRRLLEDPGFRERITAVRIQFDKAEDLKDPNLLKNAFAEISAAFDEVDDQQEVERWRRKADEQAAKLHDQ